MDDVVNGLSVGPNLAEEINDPETTEGGLLMCVWLEIQVRFFLEQ